MGQILPTSPFSKTDLRDIHETYSRKGSHLGLLFPDGRIMINYNDATSMAVLKQIAGVLGADVVTIRGTWTFTPDIESEEEE